MLLDKRERSQANWWDKKKLSTLVFHRKAKKNRDRKSLPKKTILIKPLPGNKPNSVFFRLPEINLDGGSNPQPLHEAALYYNEAGWVCRGLLTAARKCISRLRPRAKCRWGAKTNGWPRLGIFRGRVEHLNFQETNQYSVIISASLSTAWWGGI